MIKEENLIPLTLEDVRQFFGENGRTNATVEFIVDPQKYEDGPRCSNIRAIVLEDDILQPVYRCDELLRHLEMHGNPCLRISLGIGDDGEVDVMYRGEQKKLPRRKQGIVARARID